MFSVPYLGMSRNFCGDGIGDEKDDDDDNDGVSDQDENKIGGAGNVRKFFRKGHEFEDGNGTKMTSYMIRFSDYNLNL